MNNTIHISSKKVAYALMAVVAFLLLANLAIIYLRFVLGFEHLRGFVDGFYFDAEANFPSLYSALAIFFCSVLLWLIGTKPTEKAKKRSFYWKVLSIIFVFLALDEFGSLHEYMIEPLRGMMDQSSIDSDYLYFAWFIPYLILVVLLGLLLCRFLFTLPATTRWLFILGGIVFLSGAVGLEMVGGKYWAEQGWAIDGGDPVDMQYALIVTVEELLEMVGIIIFIYALMRYYLDRSAEHSFHFIVKDRNGPEVYSTDTERHYHRNPARSPRV